MAAGGFFAASGGGAAAGAEPAGAGGGAERGEPALGSGFMMLTGGVEAAVGKSALVGLPVSRVGAKGAASAGANVVPGACPKPATAGPAAGLAAAAAAGAAMFHDAA